MSNMRTSTVWGTLVAGILLGCGSGSDGAPDNTHAAMGGSVNSGGTTSSIGGSSSTDSRGTIQSSGGTLDVGGSVAAGGSTGGASPGTGGSGGATAGGNTTADASATGNPDTSICAIWPQSKLLPAGPVQFYGPNPGPCGSTTTATDGSSALTIYSYSGNVISSATNPTRTNTYTYAAGVLSSYTSVSAGQTTTVQVSWATDSVTLTLSTGMTIKYVFSANGYLLEEWFSSAVTVPTVLITRYEYSDCRLVRETSFNSDGSIDAKNTSTFGYDPAGRIVTQRDGWGTVTTYDYSCW